MSRQSPDTPKTHIFLVATSKREKTDQLNELARKYHYPVEFHPITVLGKPVNNPEEKTGTYKGNMGEKCKTAAEFLSRFKEREAIDTLAKNLHIPEQDIRSGKYEFYGAAEDSGLWFGEPDNGKNGRANGNGKVKFKDIFFDLETYDSPVDEEVVRGIQILFERLTRKDPKDPKQQKDKKAEFPGTETIHIFNAAGGVENFFRLVDIAAKRAGYEVNPTPRRGNTLRMAENSMIGAFPWTPGKFIVPGDMEPLIMRANVERGLIFKSDSTPRAEAVSYNYAIPADLFTQGKYDVCSDLEPEYQPASRYQAFKKLMESHNCNIKRITNEKKWQEYQKSQRAPYAYKVGMIVEHSPSALKLFSSPSSYRLEKECTEAGMAVEAHISGSNTPFNEVCWDDPEIMEQWFDKNDAFVIYPGSNLLKRCDLLSKLAMYASLYPQGKGKTIILYTPPGTTNAMQDSSYEIFQRVFNHGASGTRPRITFRTAGTAEGVYQILNDARNYYHRVEAEPTEQNPVPDITQQMDVFTIGAFMSSALEGVYEEKACYLSRRIQEEGWGSNFGLGDQNMMGGFLEGGRNNFNKTGQMKMAGSTTKIIAVSECKNGTIPTEIPSKYSYIAPDITKRKEFIYKNSQVFICMEGGPGTLDELITFMALKRSKSPLVEGKTMIISESGYLKTHKFDEVVNAYVALCCKGKKYAELKPDERKELGLIVMRPVEKERHRQLFETEIDAVMKVIKEIKREKEKEALKQKYQKAPQSTRPESHGSYRARIRHSQPLPGDRKGPIH